MWEGFHSSFKPAQAYMVINVGKNIKLDPTCINCGFSVIKTAELKSHEMLHTGKKFIKCHIFGEYFYTAGLKHHSFSHAFLCSFQRREKCNQCDYSFSEVGNLRMHLMKNTVEKKSNNCNRCAFSQSDNLRTHLITYRGGAHTNVTSVTRHSLMQAI